MKMNRVIVGVLPLLFSAATAFAQSPESGIRESTDPSRIAEVERHAQELRAGQTMDSRGQARMEHSATGEHGSMHRDGKRHHERRHGHHRMHDGHPKGAPNSGK
jgi:hypothetical protein